MCKEKFDRFLPPLGALSGWPRPRRPRRPLGARKSDFRRLACARVSVLGGQKISRQKNHEILIMTTPFQTCSPARHGLGHIPHDEVSSQTRSGFLLLTKVAWPLTLAHCNPSPFLLFSSRAAPAVPELLARTSSPVNVSIHSLSRSLAPGVASPSSPWL